MICINVLCVIGCYVLYSACHEPTKNGIYRVPWPAGSSARLPVTFSFRTDNQHAWMSEYWFVWSQCNKYACYITPVNPWYYDCMSALYASPNEMQFTYCATMSISILCHTIMIYHDSKNITISGQEIEMYYYACHFYVICNIHFIYNFRPECREMRNQTGDKPSRTEGQASFWTGMWTSCISTTPCSSSWPNLGGDLRIQISYVPRVRVCLVWLTSILDERAIMSKYIRVNNALICLIMIYNVLYKPEYVCQKPQNMRNNRPKVTFNIHIYSERNLCEVCCILIGKMTSHSTRIIFRGVDSMNMSLYPRREHLFVVMSNNIPTMEFMFELLPSYSLHSAGSRRMGNDEPLYLIYMCRHLVWLMHTLIFLRYIGAAVTFAAINHYPADASQQSRCQLRRQEQLLRVQPEGPLVTSELFCELPSTSSVKFCIYVWSGIHVFNCCITLFVSHENMSTHPYQDSRSFLRECRYGRSNYTLDDPRLYITLNH